MARFHYFPKVHLYFFVLLSFKVSAQQPNCSLKFGTNIGGLADYMTEMPLVDVMRHSREWYTTNATGEQPFDSEKISGIPVDANGYPLEIPYSVNGTPQIIKTIWANLSAWPEGDYTLLFDGDGDFDYWGDLSLVSQSGNRKILKFIRPASNEGTFELKITRSNPANPVKNVRLLMPGTETTYQTQPFYLPFRQRLLPFKALRFMDWGQTNNFASADAASGYDQDSDSVRVEWSQRAQMGSFSWANNKGIPYEMMIELCNQLDKDMWICIPHNASNDYIRQMATLVKTRLKPNLKVYVEYSNETWNWMFAQAQWLNKFGQQTTSWPERIVPFIQNAMDRWTEGFAGQMGRCVRVVGVQAAWQDVSNRVVFNMRPNSFDAFSPAAYFGLSESSDSTLDVLGTNATANDIIFEARKSRLQDEMVWLRQQKTEIADVLKIPMIYYEGGQHLTPTPFGDEPTYAQALIDVQRDPAMYGLYNDWFDFLKTLNTSTEPTLFMSFSFVSSRSARYGSWGILETITQNIDEIPAPKYRSIMNQINNCPDCLPEGLKLCIPIKTQIIK